MSTAAFVILAVRQVSWWQVWQGMTQADGLGLGLCAGALALAYSLRGERWRLCLPQPVERPTCQRVLMTGYMGNNLLPARGGEVLRVYFMGRLTGLDAAGTLATVVLERILDGLILCLALVVGWGMSGSLDVPWGMRAVVWMFGGAGFVIALLIIGGSCLQNYLAHLSWLPGRRLMQQFVAGLQGLQSWTRLGWVLAWSLLIWSLESVGFVGMLLAFHLPAQINHALLYMSAANFASLVPAAPAGWGTVEHFTTEFLVRVGLPREPVLGMVLSQHMLYFGITTCWGLWSWVQIQMQMPDAAQSDPVSTVHSWDCLEPTTAAPPLLSILIPAKDEEHRLPATLTEILHYIEQSPQWQTVAIEIWVVDDGSHDRTAAVVEQFRQHAPNVGLIRYQPNRGKGHALKTGIAHSRGRYILMADADGATPIAELDRLWDHLTPETPIVVGSRVLKDDHTQVKTLWYRQWMGWLFVRLVQMLSVQGIFDTQCGFKVLERTVADDLARHLTLDGFSFDVELLFIAQRRGYGIREVAINWVNQPGSKVHLWADGWRMAIDIAGIRWKAKQGWYERYLSQGAPANPAGDRDTDEGYASNL
ncbi:MAG: hypothetical protein OHK0012_28360 [Synechococcales cyanobacterium]